MYSIFDSWKLVVFSVFFPAAITAESHQQSGLHLVGSVGHCGARGAGCHQQVGCALLLVKLAWKYLDIVQLLHHVALRFQDKPPSKLFKKATS